MDVKLPQLAEGVESGTVVSILVAEGQEVKKDQPIMELETQKAVGSIPAPTAGVVTKIHVKQGMEVSVGHTLLSIDTGSGATAAPAATATARQGTPSAPPPAALPEAQPSHNASSSTPVTTPTADYHYESKSGVPPPASPSIRRIAREL